jgi:hypothetical protein
MKRQREQSKRRTIKLISTLYVITASALLPGCAGMGSGLVLETIGPAPGQSVEASSGPGTLVVYSAYKVNADFNSRNPNVPEYSDYRILNADGKVLKWIHNVADDYLQGPVSVELPAGKYSIVARSNGYGYVTIPVMIETRQNTILHLDGNDSWSDESAFNQTNAVRLPDGQIVGWKVTSNL